MRRVTFEREPNCNYEVYCNGELIQVEEGENTFTYTATGEKCESIYPAPAYKVPHFDYTLPFENVDPWKIRYDRRPWHFMSGDSLFIKPYVTVRELERNLINLRSDKCRALVIHASFSIPLSKLIPSCNFIEDIFIWGLGYRTPKPIFEGVRFPNLKRVIIDGELRGDEHTIRPKVHTLVIRSATFTPKLGVNLSLISPERLHLGRIDFTSSDKEKLRQQLLGNSKEENLIPPIKCTTLSLECESYYMLYYISPDTLKHIAIKDDGLVSNAEIDSDREVQTKILSRFTNLETLHAGVLIGQVNIPSLKALHVNTAEPGLGSTEEAFPCEGEHSLEELSIGWCSHLSINRCNARLYLNTDSLSRLTSDEYWLQSDPEYELVLSKDTELVQIGCPPTFTMRKIYNGKSARFTMQ